MPLSVVMPSYNGMKYLTQAVDSVLSQSYQDWELLISDDGSTDGTREYLSTISDARVKLFFQPRNLGIFGNLNFLFSHAACAITQILCQDDYLLDEGALQRLTHEWEKLPQSVAFLRCNHGLNAGSGRLPRFGVGALPSLISPEEADLLFFTFGCIPGNLSNVSVRTEYVSKVGWFRPDLPYAGDFEFWSRLASVAPFVISRTPIAYVRVHPDQASVTLNRRGELLSQTREVLNPIYARLLAEGYSPWLLRLMATVNYISRHRDRGVKDVIRGKGYRYLTILARELDSAPFSCGVLGGWIAFFASLGGRIGLVATAKQVLKLQPAANHRNA